MEEKFEKCENCRFWRKYEDRGHGTEGSCHRHPPIYLGAVLNPQVDFPEVRNDDWCGEFLDLTLLLY